jgi:hypothetical protein
MRFGVMASSIRMSNGLVLIITNEGGMFQAAVLMRREEGLDLTIVSAKATTENMIVLSQLTSLWLRLERVTETLEGGGMCWYFQSSSAT